MDESLIRVQKIIADAGLASRREAERDILEGLVTINGKRAKLGDKADPEKDAIKYKNELITHRSLTDPAQWVALYKPREFTTQLQKPVDEIAEEKIVHKPIPSAYDLLPRLKKGQWFCLSRLDTDAEGIVLFTNKGKYQKKFQDAKYEIPKLFEIKVDGPQDLKKFEYMKKGFKVENQRFSINEYQITESSTSKFWMRLETTVVQNRLLRKALEHLGYRVDKVSRLQFANISIKGLQRGQHRFLAPIEEEVLLKWVGEGKS